MCSLYVLIRAGVEIIGADMWTRKRTVIADRVTADDWEIYRDGCSVGRVYLDWLTNPTRRMWKWSKTFGYGRGGYVQGLDQALDQLRAAVLEMEHAEDSVFYVSQQKIE